MGHLIRRVVLTSLICLLSAHVCPAKGTHYHHRKHVAVVSKTDREINCLASAIYKEAGNQSEEGKIAVAFVTFNRAERSHLTVCQVIGQTRQFRWRKHRFYADQYKESAELARKMYFNRNEYEDLTEGALFFHARYVRKPKSWRKYVRTVRIEDHIFYTLPELKTK